MYTGYSNQLITWLMVVNQMLPYISFAYTLQLTLTLTTTTKNTLHHDSKMVMWKL